MAEHFISNRPRYGYCYCYLDFLEVWLYQAIVSKSSDDAYKWSRQLAHYALLMEPLVSRYKG